MINPSQYASLILEPAFRFTGMYSLNAMYLMLRTALTESGLCHLRQLPFGPALGFMQVEPNTYRDVYRYLNTRKDILEKILVHCNYKKFPEHTQNLVHDLAFNALVARVKYWMIPEPIPSYTNVERQAEYWKMHYNTKHGLGTVEKFMRAAEGTEGCIMHRDALERRRANESD